MKFISLYIMLGLIWVLSGCNKECSFSDSTCTETPPTDELCQAAFNRWFYDADAETCEMKFYSGCSHYGFETEAECLACDCE